MTILELFGDDSESEEPTTLPCDRCNDETAVTDLVDGECINCRSCAGCGEPEQYDDGLCLSCFREDHGSEDLYNYHDVDVIGVHGWPQQSSRAALLFGVELEMESRGLYLPPLLGGRDGGMANEGQYILMEDGSLDSTGVELITCPYTLEFHQGLFGWDKLLKGVATAAKSGAGTDRCGMHVHVSRRVISALTLGKALVFVNSDRNSLFIETIAQRDSQRYARRHKKKISDGRERETAKYEALHLTSRTVEFRIFRGNLRPDRVLKNIEFCHSVIKYAAQASNIAVETHTDYLAWLTKNRSTYPNLCAFLTEKGYSVGVRSPKSLSKEI
jgi:hypothetical protein